MKNLAAVAGAMIATAGLILAQGAGGQARSGRPAPGGKALQEQLQLTDQQVTQLRDLRKQQFESTAAQRQQLRTAATSLRDMMQSANPDAAAVGKQTLEVKQLREQVRSAQQEYAKKALALLTPQQAEKLKDLEAALKMMPAARQAQAMGLIEAPAGVAAMGAGRMARRPMQD